MSAGTNDAARSPAFRLSPKNDEMVPTDTGPSPQPKSPGRASSANIAVPPSGTATEAVLKTPAQRMPAAQPQRAHPASAKAGCGAKTAVRHYR